MEGTEVMSIQVLEVALFDGKGERQLVFSSLGPNADVKRSNVGKAILQDIVDYCLDGNHGPHVPGVAENTVTWYVVRLQVDRQRIIIGRPALVNGQRTCSEVFLQVGDEKGLPDYSELTPNADLAAISGLMTQALGTTKAVSWAVGHNLWKYHVGFVDVKKVEAGEGFGTGILIRFEHRLDDARLRRVGAAGEAVIAAVKVAFDKPKVVTFTQ